MGGAYATFSSAGETAQTDQDHFLSVLLLLRVLGLGSGPGCLRSPRRRRSHPRKRSCSRSFWPSVNDECARECWTNEEQMFGCETPRKLLLSVLFSSTHPSIPPSLPLADLPLLLLCWLSRRLSPARHDPEPPIKRQGETPPPSSSTREGSSGLETQVQLIYY